MNVSVTISLPRICLCFEPWEHYVRQNHVLGIFLCDDQDGLHFYSLVFDS
jgi:hypothetical protein